MENSAKILLLGKTGVGKSSFINYFLGKAVAQTAAGKPVTQEYFIPYEIEDGRYPIEIFDTKGLEAIGACDQLDEIITGIKKRNNSNDIFNWFHTIFYCVSMTTKFENFEAEFIRKLQKELSQHIHIILTHCDASTPEIIAKMRQTIAEKLGSIENIEIFEVVCVSKKKRNGTVAEPYGKEKISERVFDLLLEDIAHRISADYAQTLLDAYRSVAYRVYRQAEKKIDDVVKLKTLWEFIQDDEEANEHLDAVLDRLYEDMEQELETAQANTDKRFNEILKPATQLYASYRGVVTDSYVEGAELALSDALEWLDVDWMDEMDDDVIARKIFPKTGKYMDKNGEFPDGDDSSIFETLRMIGAGIGDLFSLKKNLKKALQELLQNFMERSIPSQDDIRTKVCERILKYMKSDILIEPEKIGKII